MLSGDGCLTKRNKKGGYKNYSIDFFNIDIEIIKLFDNLFFELFKTRENYNKRVRKNKKDIYEYKKYSKKLYYKVASLGFPKGLKKDSLKVQEIIKKRKIKFFPGVSNN